jgi:signal transduction histidine kinase
MKPRTTEEKAGLRESPGINDLSKAFTSFSEASRSLERYYAALDVQIRDLRLELKKKDEILLRNEREKEALKEVSERRSRFAAMGEMVAKIVHDIRNPLGSIELFASMLRNESKEEDHRQMLEQILFGVRTINQSLSNLLLFTEIPSPVFREIPLLPLIEESLQVVAPAAGKRGIETAMEVPGDIRFSADAALIKQVFLNLFLNAVQGMPRGGVLRVEASVPVIHRTRWLEILIQDTGEGIGPEHLQRVFDPFFTTREKGAGLGLAIVHNILLAHEGSIRVESELGEGSRWILRLPWSVRGRG